MALIGLQNKFNIFHGNKRKREEEGRKEGHEKGRKKGRGYLIVEHC